MAATWAVVVPPLQGPDEIGHFTYVQRLVERGTIPWERHTVINPPGVSPYSSEVNVAQVPAGFGPLAANPAARPYWTSADVRLWAQRDRMLGKDARTDGGFTSAQKNPPAYYLYEALPYELARNGSFFDRQMIMRLANIPLLLAALVFVWLMAGELLGRGRSQIIATASSLLLPQLTNMVATINPDMLLVAEWSAALYLMVLIIRRGPTLWRDAALIALTLAGGLTHPRSLPLFLPMALTFLIVLARRRGWHRVTPLRATLAAVGAYVLVVFAASTVDPGNLRQFASYLWQFYLPRLGFMTPKLGPPNYGFRQAVTDRLYGTLAQLEVVLPHNLGTWMYWITLAGLVALVLALIRFRHELRANAAVVLVLASAVFALVLGVHFAAYRGMIHAPSDPVFTARYLLPLLPLFGAAIALIERSAPRRAGALFAGLVFALGLALQFESIGLLVERFYA